MYHLHDNPSDLLINSQSQFIVLLDFTSYSWDRLISIYGSSIMDNQVNKLHSLNEKLCRFESHSKFIQICISEGIKPWTHFLRHHFTWPNRNILRSATYSVLCTCRAFYTRAITIALYVVIVFVPDFYKFKGPALLCTYTELSEWILLTHDMVEKVAKGFKNLHLINEYIPLCLNKVLFVFLYIANIFLQIFFPECPRPYTGLYYGKIGNPQINILKKGIKYC